MIFLNEVAGEKSWTGLARFTSTTDSTLSVVVPATLATKAGSFTEEML